MWSYNKTLSSSELCHHGILGMKWGVRRYQNKDGTLTAEGKRRKEKADDDKSPDQNNTRLARKSLSEMDETELRNMITRLELEKKYQDLVKQEEVKKENRGKKFVLEILESSGKNIASQLTTYVLGSAVNKALGTNAVNPKKGQKDK